MEQTGAPQGQVPLFSQEQISRLSGFLTGQQERDQRNFQALLAAVTEALAETDVSTLLRKVVDRTIQITNTERGLLLLHDGEELKVVVARDRSGRDLPKDVPTSRSIPQMVFTEGRPLQSRVGQQGDVLDLSRSVAAMRLRQVMCAPLRVRGNTLGVLYVDSTAAGPGFASSDMLLFDTQAALAAMAIANHRLLQETMEARVVHDQLRTAREIQRRLLPGGPLVHAGTSLAGVSDPYELVGGDYYDYFPISASRLGITIADVSGHGIGSALVMSNVRAHLRSLLDTRRSLGGIYGLLNRALCQDLTAGMFVSLFVAIFERREMTLEYQNAGQGSPLLYDPSTDRLREIEANASALGILDDRSAGACPVIAVHPGEYLVCYTDGVTESPDPDGEMFGEERLVDVVRAQAKARPDPGVLLSSILGEVKRHTKARPARDDITVLVARF